MSEPPAPHHPERHDGMPAGEDDYPLLGSPGWQLVPQTPDWPEWHDDPGYLAARDADDPGDPEESDEYEDPDNAPPPGLDDAELAALIAEAREAAADQEAAAAERAAHGQTGLVAALSSVASGRRGPGMPGSAESVAGESGSRAAGFASGKPLDVARGCPVLAQFAEEAAGDDDRYPRASDDELLGVICAWDRIEANASAQKHAAVAELLRRRPATGSAVDAGSGIPEQWGEFVGREIGAALAVSSVEAEEAVALAAALETSLPGTRAAYHSGIVTHDKARIIAAATMLLDPAEARAAEAMVLDRAGSMTPAGLRAAISRAVMEVNPEKAKKRREHAARKAHVARWAEPSGNAGLTGRELPPAEVLAADQRITWWATQLRKTGLDGDMDVLRARAFLDILLGIDSRPHPHNPASTPAGTASPASPGHMASTASPGRAEARAQVSLEFRFRPGR